MWVWASHSPGSSAAPARSTVRTDAGSTGARPRNTPAMRSPSIRTSPSKGRSEASPEQVTTRAWDSRVRAGALMPTAVRG